jgi:hypothetical protein
MDKLEGDWKLPVELPKPFDTTIRPHHAHGCGRSAPIDPERFKFLLHGSIFLSLSGVR